jgi:flagellar biosynthesis/type III secretory pathway protein FliH
MDDVLRDTPVYQEMTRWAREEGLREGLQEGLREGRQEGRQEGLQEGLQQALLAIVTEHFPKLVRLAKKQMAGIKEPEALQLLIVKMSIAQSAEEAQQYLLEVDEEE